MKPYWLAAISICTLLLVLIFISPSKIINPDCSMFLRAGEIIISGGVPYTDFVELNPPLVFYVHTIPAWLAQASRLSVETSLYIFTIALFALALVLVYDLLRREKEKEQADFFGPTIIAFCLGNLVCYEWVQFGQRQQLLANALLPFFICRYLRWHGYKINLLTAIFSGLFAGTMVCLLPQYAAIIISLEIFYLIQKRRLNQMISPETISVLACPMAYAMLLLCNEPLKGEFLQRWLPMVSQGYALYNWPWPMQVTQLIVSGILPTISAAILILIVAAKKAKLSLTGPLPPILVFCLGAFLAILLQGKCILNQTIPLMYGALMLCCSIPLALRSKENYKSSFMATLTASVITLFVFLLPVYAIPGVISQNKTWQTVTFAIKSLVEKESNLGEKVSILSLSLPDSYPALPAANRASGNRYFFVFPMLMTDYLANKCTNQAEKKHWLDESKKFVNDLNDDLLKNRPRLVLIQENVMPCADISVRHYLERTSFWPHLEADYQPISQLKTGVTELSVWRRH